MKKVSKSMHIDAFYYDFSARSRYGAMFQACLKRLYRFAPLESLLIGLIGGKFISRGGAISTWRTHPTAIAVRLLILHTKNKVSYQ